MNYLEEKLRIKTELYNFYKFNGYRRFYSDNGVQFDEVYYPPRKEYSKYLQFFAAGKDNQDRVLLSANRIGKTTSICGYECRMHTTGDYPAWWPGYKFHKPITALVAGNTAQTTRDIIQTPLFGERDPNTKKPNGVGIFAKDDIVDVSYQSGSTGAIDYILIKNKWDKDVPSKILFRAYEQGRKAAEGITCHFLWVDEECGMDFFGEAYRSLFTTKGRSIMSFTPLAGFTELVESVLPTNEMPVYDPDLYINEIRQAIEYVHASNK